MKPGRWVSLGVACVASRRGRQEMAEWCSQVRISSRSTSAALDLGLQSAAKLCFTSDATARCTFFGTLRPAGAPAATFAADCSLRQRQAGGRRYLRGGLLTLGRRCARGTFFALCLCAALCPAARGDVETFCDDFDAGTSGSNWALFSAAGDYVADFAFDYSTRGIVPAPNTVGATTVGLYLTVNKNDAVAAKDAVGVYPVGCSFDGEYKLKFDLWMNYNGGSGGGVGSTEFATGGINHSGTRVCWPDNAASDGLWFAVSGEGGDTLDYRAYRGATALSATGFAANSQNHTASFYQTLFPSPTYETAGAPGKHWVEFEVRQRRGVIQWRLNSMLVAMRVDTTVTAGDLMVGYMDTFASIASPAADNFGVVDNVRIEVPDCNGNGVSDAADLLAGTSQDCNLNGNLDDCETIAGGDFDVDGDVDFADLTAFTECAAGPGVLPAPNPLVCLAAYLAAFDVDASSAVDVRDYAALQCAATVGLIPVRPAGAPLGSQFLASVVGLTLTERDSQVLAQVTGGNIPGFLRTFRPVTVSAVIGGNPTTATYWVMPDYVCIGRDDDFVRMPMMPTTAQSIADAFGCLLPTRKMVNDIWSAATVKLAPAPISPATVDITLATTFFRHHEMIEAQRAGQTLGALIGGIKKDVVITPLLASNPGKVAIYGWHYQNGTPIQPLYLGHSYSHVDYSHGIRLVKQQMVVNGVEQSVASVLADPNLCVLLSDEGVVTNPRY